MTFTLVIVTLSDFDFPWALDNFYQQWTSSSSTASVVASFAFLGF